MSWTTLAGLAGVMLLGAISPGPDFVIVLRNALSGGRRAGIGAAIGVGLGVMVWALAAAVGVAGLLAASAQAYTIVKLCGAAYLFYIGVRSLLSAARASESHLDTRPGEQPASAWAGFRSGFRQGLVTNLLNPKSAVFFLALLPSFMPRHLNIEAVAEVTALVGIIGAGWFTIVALTVDRLRRILNRPRPRRILDAVTGSVLIALGIRVATEHLH